MRLWGVEMRTGGTGRQRQARGIGAEPADLAWQPSAIDLQSFTMKGNPKVIAELNAALKEELTAINQYFLHAEMCENWKYDKLGDFIKKQSIDEMKHAEMLIERLLFLDATPIMNEAMQLNIGSNVREQLQADLKLEVGAVAQYNNAVKIARDEGDNASRELFERLLKDEEEHVDWLEAQVHQIKEIGYERYLSQQIREEK
jgi:bacterioferritin